MAKITKIPSILCLSLIRVYQYLVSPWWVGCCRFEPHCSEYAIISIHRFGVIRGLGLTILRLLKCHPWSRQKGCDPVPKH